MACSSISFRSSSGRSSRPGRVDHLVAVLLEREMADEDALGGERVLGDLGLRAGDPGHEARLAHVRVAGDHDGRLVLDVGQVLQLVARVVQEPQVPVDVVDDGGHAGERLLTDFHRVRVLADDADVLAGDLLRLVRRPLQRCERHLDLVDAGQDVGDLAVEGPDLVHAGPAFGGVVKVVRENIAGGDHHRFLDHSLVCIGPAHLAPSGPDRT